MDHNEEIDVPPYFICPISLQIMKDPVTVSTGITYDRESIEKWVFTNNNKSCPVTKQPLNIDSSSDSFLTPNHTLRRLAQSWCTLNASLGVERFPTPKPPVSRAEVLKLIDDASNSSAQRLLKNLEKMKSIAYGSSSANKRCLETTLGVPEFLARLIAVGDNNSSSSSSSVSDDALKILCHLQISDDMILKKLLKENQGTLVDSLARIMQRNSYDESRAYAIGLMERLAQVAEPTQLVTFSRQHFVKVIELIKDGVSPKATKAALKVLALACPWGRNRIRVVEAGAVEVMIDLLLESNHHNNNGRRTSEMVLAVLDQLSGCAEGRAELIGHAAGLAVVSKKILRVSHYATERGVKILYGISKYSGSPSVVQEMVQIGVVTKLCLLLQVDCEGKTKEKTREILKMHARAWKNSPCAPPHVFGFD